MRRPDTFTHRPVRGRRSWDVVDPAPHPLEELERGTPVGRFCLTPDRDYAVLRSLLQYNFLTARHFVSLELFRSLDRAHDRLHALWRVGLVARCRIIHPEADRGPTSAHRLPAWEYAYGITALGVAALRRYDDREALRLPASWTPPYAHNSQRTNPDHDTAVADLCLQIMDYLGARYTVIWHGPRTARAVLALPDSSRQALFPDAALDITGPAGGRLALIEHDQSVRPDTVMDRLTGYAAYWLAAPWRKMYPGLTAAPLLIWSVSSTRDRERYWANPFEEVRKLGARFPILYRRVWLIAPDDWRNGIYQATPLDPHGTPHHLHTLVDGTIDRE
jgi:hypothetical protein